MSVSQKHGLELTIFGYIRLNYDKEIPADICSICLDYYTKIEIIWDVFCEQLASFVSDNGLDVKVKKREPYSTFASSTGWNKGIHCFTLLIVDSDDYPCGHYGAGIISSEEISRIASEDGVIFSNPQNQNVNGYALDAGSIWYFKTGSWFEKRLFRGGQYIKKNDELTVIVDCDNWNIMFYVNGEILGKPFDIVQSKTYHPVFTVWHKKDVSLQLVETIIDIESEKNRYLTSEK